MTSNSLGRLSDASFDPSKCLNITGAKLSPLWKNSKRSQAHAMNLHNYQSPLLLLGNKPAVTEDFCSNISLHHHSRHQWQWTECVCPHSSPNSSVIILTLNVMGLGGGTLGDN